jgi:hypothetical protein
VDRWIAHHGGPPKAYGCVVLTNNAFDPIAVKPRSCCRHRHRPALPEQAFGMRQDARADSPGYQTSGHWGRNVCLPMLSSGSLPEAGSSVELSGQPEGQALVVDRERVHQFAHSSPTVVKFYFNSVQGAPIEKGANGSSASAARGSFEVRYGAPELGPFRFRHLDTATSGAPCSGISQNFIKARNPTFPTPHGWADGSSIRMVRWGGRS